MWSQVGCAAMHKLCESKAPQSFFPQIKSVLVVFQGSLDPAHLREAPTASCWDKERQREPVTDRDMERD